MDKVLEAGNATRSPTFRRGMLMKLLRSLKKPTLATRIILRTLVLLMRKLWNNTNSSGSHVGYGNTGSWNNGDLNGGRCYESFNPYNGPGFLTPDALQAYQIDYWVRTLVMPILSSIWPLWQQVNPVNFLIRQTYIDTTYSQHTQSHRWLSRLLVDTLAVKPSRDLEVTDFPAYRELEKKDKWEEPHYIVDENDRTKLVVSENGFPVNFRPLNINVFWFYKYGTLFRVEKNGKLELRQTSDGWAVNGKMEEVDPNIYIRSFSRSREPLIKFLQEARNRYGVGVRRYRYVQMFIWIEDLKWNALRPKPGRGLNSIILPRAMKETILKDATDFFNSRDWYAERGITWKRGWVLYGPPGGGKTSVISALATTFDLPIYILPVGSLMNDTTLAKAMAGVGSKCILVLEDIHALFTLDQASTVDPTQDEDLGGGYGVGKQSAATLSTMLNMLDGLDSGEARITIATSNVPPSRMFNDALSRPGRFDRFFHFKNATRQQARDLFLSFYLGVNTVSPDIKEMEIDEVLRLADDWVAMIQDEQYSVATLQGHLIVNKDDPRAALKAMPEFIEKAVEAEKEAQARKEADAKKNTDQKKIMALMRRSLAQYSRDGDWDNGYTSDNTGGWGTTKKRGGPSWN